LSCCSTNPVRKSAVPAGERAVYAGPIAPDRLISRRILDQLDAALEESSVA
jgi:hypothetical protein